MSLDVQKQRLSIVEYFDSVINEIDLFTEKEAHKSKLDRNELNKNREVLIKQVKECEKASLSNLAQQNKLNPNFSFCFVLNHGNNLRLVVTDTFLSQPNIDIFKSLALTGRYATSNQTELARIFQINHQTPHNEPFFEIETDFYWTEIFKNNLVVKLTASELFKSTRVSIRSIGAESIEPESIHLFSNNQSMSIFISNEKSVQETSQFLSLFANEHSNLKLTVQVKLKIDSETDSEINKVLNPLKKFKMENLRVEFADNLCYDLISERTFKELFNWFETLTVLKLSHIKIGSIGAKSFTCFSNLVHLDLSNLSLKIIDSNAFFGLEKLMFLILSDNRLENIEKGTFDSMGYLEVLNLSHNQLKMFESGTFANLAGLKILDLGHNPLEKNLDEDSFCGPLYLARLVLTETPLHEIINSRPAVITKHFKSHVYFD
jgi:hypothetical protein